jgi:hypothetical protein
MKRIRVARALTGMTALSVAIATSVTAVSSAVAAPPAPVAAKSPGVVKSFEKHPFYTHEWGLDHPSGATYADGPGVLAIAERRGDGSVVALLKPERESVVARMTVAGLTDPETLTDNGHGTLAALDGQTLLTWSAAARGTATVKRQTVQGVSLRDAAGMTYDPSTQRWLVLDAARQQIVVLHKQGSTVQATDGVSLAGLGASRLQGIALDSSSGRTYVADPASSRLYAVAADGTQEQVLDVSDIDTQSLGSLAFGPTADPTDSAKLSSLYAALSGDTSTFGQVSEMSLQPLSATATTVATSSTGSLVRKSLLSQLSPPSPDPAGIVYMTDSQRLLVGDSEVDEMSIYAGVNMWQISRDGSTRYDTGTTLKFSKEPTGLAYDPQGKRVFISDDDKGKVFQVTAGGDNRFGTSDDPVSSISATAFGDNDAEDVAYDTATGDLFASQGVGSEVYRVSAGANGRFDGIPPTGDDTVSHFDVGVYGITDGECLGYSPTRDSLFMADPTAGKIIEVTKTGALVQTIDVTAIGMKNPADITFAPATDDPTRTDMYVVTRGIDNDKHPDENDGTMYEISAPNLGPTTAQVNTAPTVSAGADSTVTLPASALLHGTVSDDGLPNPPGFTTKSWTRVSGPGTVTFGDPTAADTTASFGAAGTYLLRLTATDSALTTADDVTVVVNPQSSTNSAPSVFAGNDQTITLPGSASLSGTVSDDGLPNPPGSTAVAWSKVSGPGSVSFADPSSTSTLASFSVDGAYVLRLTASDSVLTATDDISVVVQPAPSVGNLVKNPGFEVDTSGWKGSSGTTLTRVASPHSGSWSGQMTNTSTASTRCTLNDSPNWIPSTTPGTYRLSAWVKGDAAGVGSMARLIVNEYVGTTLVGSKEVGVALATDWQKLELAYVPVSAGSSWLDYNVVRSSTPAGAVCFLADDLSATN